MLPPTRYADLAGGEVLAYCEFGDPAGRPLLYIHGWPSSRYQGWAYDEAAKERGIRILAPDRPGVGCSPAVPGRRLCDWPAMAAAFADALGVGKFATLGVSGGGPYATATAALLPDRLEAAGVVCGAVVLGEGARIADMHPAYRVLGWVHRHAHPLLALPLLLGRLLTASEAVARQLPRFASMPAVDRATLADPELFGHEYRCFRAATENGLAGVVADGDIYLGDWGFDLGAIAFPLRFWHGVEDRNIPPAVVRPVVDQIPSAEVHWCEGEGHYSMAIARPGKILDGLFAPPGQGGARF